MKNKYRILEDKLARFAQGTECHSYELLGARPAEADGTQGTAFSVWAPGVKSVRVTGDFNGWQPGEHWLAPVGESGVWTGFVPGVGEGALYKYLIETAVGELLYKADPYAFSAEIRPGTASRVADVEGYPWKDGLWMTRRRKRDHFKKPMNIYEVHLGSWRQHDVPRASQEDVPAAAFYNYREMADELVPYVKDMGYTHV